MTADGDRPALRMSRRRSPARRSAGLAVSCRRRAVSAIGVDSVNGDQTHNIFNSFAGYTVAEISTNDGGAPVTIYVQNGTIVCPTPGGA